MGCTLNDFTVGEWKKEKRNGHVVEVAPATTVRLKLDGALLKIDGKFKGFTGSVEAALDWADNCNSGR